MKISCLMEGSSSVPTQFRPFALKMEEQNMPPIVINVFKCFYAQLLYGAQGKLTERDIDPIGENELKTWADLKKYASAGRKALNKAVVIKLNGGLGTSMGLEKAKSLITVRDGMDFLDLTLRQMEILRKKTKAKVPLVFMNSFKTHRDTMLKTDEFEQGDPDIPRAFVQHRYPKILEKDYSPAEWESNPELEWNPPGHGDIYTALVTSRVLSQLLENGYQYAFVSNSDNLGALLDERLLGYMATEHLPFLMEVARRTPQDRKGGHLARLKKNDRLVLREVAQTLESEMEDFTDIDKYRFFNTNSLWVDLKELEKVFVQHRMMPLDLIVNPKNLDPREPDSPEVLQIETAMGSAISNFENAAAVEVPRRRFAPVKTTNDLLLVMSDCYMRTEDETIEPNPEREGPMPNIDLDGSRYKKIDDFTARFPHGAPSLLACESLTVKGDVKFGENVVCKGHVTVVNKAKKQKTVNKERVLEGEVVL
jgi:UTP--glucose-1-phosphate uridylyltransferase